LAIAHTALGIVDRDGLEALSLRKVAATLGVGAMTLYRYVPDRDAIVSDVVALLLSEVDTAEKPGETWDETIRRVARSLRAMALRHPLTFQLVALAPIDEPPVLDYARSIQRLHAAQGIAEERFVESWSVIDSFLTGFLLMETAAITRASSTRSGPHGHGIGEEPLHAHLLHVLSPEAFEAALGTIISGLRDGPMAGAAVQAGPTA
jgi:AcrR family transcriptional regulator